MREERMKNEKERKKKKKKEKRKRKKKKEKRKKKKEKRKDKKKSFTLTLGLYNFVTSSCPFLASSAIFICGNRSAGRNISVITVTKLSKKPREVASMFLLNLHKIKICELK